MSDHHEPTQNLQDEDEAVSPQQDESTARSDGLKRNRARMTLLLNSRMQLARVASEFNNPGLPGTYDLRAEQHHIEVVLRQDCPDTYAEEFDNWNQWDNVEFDHPRGVLDPDCRLCVLLARHKGVNLQEPA
jgi:hypothetical protein